MIPKINHFCWFGQADYSPLIKDCMASWTEQASDYKIMKWDETNSPMDNPVVQRAIKLKKWAFAADYVRLFALYQHGGVYLDTDMELIRDITPLLSDGCFLGFESADHVGVGILGVTPKMDMIKRAMEIMEQRIEEKKPFIAIPHIFKEALGELPMQGEVINGIRFYSQEVFYPYNPYVSDRKQLMAADIKDTTFAIHHWDGSWVEKSIFKKGLLRLRDIVGI